MSSIRLGGGLFFGNVIQLHTECGGYKWSGLEDSMLPDSSRFVVSINGQSTNISRIENFGGGGGVFISVATGDIPSDASVSITYTSSEDSLAEDVMRGYAGPSNGEESGVEVSTSTTTAISFPGLITTLGAGAIIGTAGGAMEDAYIFSEDNDIVGLSEASVGKISKILGGGIVAGSFEPQYFYENPNYDPNAKTGLASYRFCNEKATGTFKSSTNAYTYVGQTLTLHDLDRVTDPVTINSWTISIVATNGGTREDYDTTQIGIPITSTRSHSPAKTVEFPLVTYTLPDNLYLPLWMVTEAMNLRSTGDLEVNRSLYGNAAADLLVTFGGDDRLEGAGSNDTLMGGDSNDTLMGGNGNDLLEGEDGNDSLSGNADNDTLDGGVGVDTLTGGTGNDTYIVDLTNVNALEDTIGNDMSGTDTLQLRGGNTITAEVVTVTLAAGLENLNASGTSTTKLNLTGHAANNTLIGNAADNILNGGAGIDSLSGGDGNDTYLIDNAKDVVTEDGGVNSGIDLLKVNIAKAGGVYTLLSNIENADIVSSVAYNLTGNSLQNTLTGNSMANVLNGGTGNDTLTGYAGNDTFTVGFGTDTITDLSVSDILIVASGATANATVTAAWTAAKASINSGTVNITTAGYAVNLAAATGTNGYTVTTSSATRLTGSTKNDTLIGSSDTDVLIGGAGNDSLTGGDGDDYFVLNAALSTTTNRDTITDFTSGDRILLENAVFKKLLVAGALNTANFVSGVAVDANDYILYNSGTGVLSYDADGSGKGVAVQIALIGTSTHAALTYADFDVI